MLLNICHVYAQSIKHDLKKDWVAVFDMRNNIIPDTLRVSQRIKDIPPQNYKCTIIWYYTGYRLSPLIGKRKTNRFLRSIINKSELNNKKDGGGRNEKWKMKYQNGQTYLQIKSKNNNCLFQMFPHYTNNELDSFILIRKEGIYKPNPYWIDINCHYHSTG